MPLDDDIRLYLFDLDGTLYLDGEWLPGAKETVERLKAAGKKVCFVTNNSSRSAWDYRLKLAGMGLEAREDEIYTSGMATAEYLKRNYPGKSVYLVGTQSLEQEFLSSGIPLTEDQPEVAVLGYDTTLTYEKLVKLTRYLVCGAVFIATHPDVNCPHPGVYLPDVGSFLALVEAATGRTPDVVCGKPGRIMGDGILARTGCPRERVAMVGDRLSTDIQFAVNNGFTGILVLSGETDEAMLQRSGLRPDRVLASVADLLKD